MLNIWHSSMSSTRPTEGRVFSAVRVGNGLPMEGFSDDSSSGIPDYMNFNWKLENVQDFKSDENEKLSDDVLDLLPSDPFGMDLATTFTAITGWLEDTKPKLSLMSGWLEDIESNFGLNSLGFVTDQGEVDVGEDRLFAEPNLIWDGAVKVPEASFESGQELWAGLWDSSIISDGSTEDFRGFSYDECWVSTDAFDEFPGCSEIHVDNTDGTGDAPHDALFFALGYLGVMDLLSVAMEKPVSLKPERIRDEKVKVKQPGLEMSTVQSELDLSYGQRYQGITIPEAYERLILDTIRGDQQHFVRRDELKAAWEIFTPLLHRIDNGEIKPTPYQPGSRGPPEGDQLLERAGYVQTHGYIWIPPTL